MTDIKVEYDSHMGDCLKVCRMAKDSFGRTTDWAETTWVGPNDLPPADFSIVSTTCGAAGEYEVGRLSEKDQRLLKMLARGMKQDDYASLLLKVTRTDNIIDVEELLWKFRHTTPHLAPFGHNFITFKFQAPVFVMRQIVKHEYIRISELSMRYVRGMPEYYRPKSWRALAKDVKQGSGGDLEYTTQKEWNNYSDWAYSEDSVDYQTALDDGLAPEQARMFLRLCHMTQGHISGSMDAIAGLVIKRLDPHAQEETREFARQIERKCREIWPWSWEAIMEGVDVTT